jgi:hypothetical protein
MGDVIKDFQKSDAPQFAGKTKEKKRQMAIAAKLEADRQQNEGVIQPTGDDSIDTGADNKGKTTYVTDKKGKLISFKHEGAWKKSTGTVTDKSGAKHNPMSQARHLARSAMKTVKEDLDEATKYVVHYTNEKGEHVNSSKAFDDKSKADAHATKGNSMDKVGGKYTVKAVQNEGVNKSDVPAYLRKKTGDKLTTQDLEKERTKNNSHPETIKKINGTEMKEQAPVAPVPGQKWKDHAVMVNGKQRVVIHRKNVGNYSKEGQKVKEDVDFDGNFVSEPMSYQEFAMMIEGKAQYVVKATHNKTGRVKVTNYVADKDESAHGVHARAEREHKPMGYSIDSVRRKDIEAHDEGEEGSTETTKRGRGRPAGSKSGARGPRIK